MNTEWKYEANKIILKSLTKQEQSFVAPKGYKLIEPHKLYYYDTKFIGDKPIAFIDIYRLPKYPNSGFILIAVHKDYQGMGIGYNLLLEAISKCKNISNLNSLLYSFNRKNHKSSNMIKRIPNIKKFYEDNSEIIYEINLKI